VSELDGGEEPTGRGQRAGGDDDNDVYGLAEGVAGGDGRKKMTKQLTGKRDDTATHAAARAGQLIAMREILSGKDAEELAAVLSRQNQAGETPLFVAAEYGYVALVAEMIKYHDVATASIKARSGYDALHIAAKQGDVGID